MSALDRFLTERATDGLLPWTAQAEAARLFSLPCGAVEAAILALGLLPARYQRNRRTISTEQQGRLFRARVAVIGCGGLGGHVIEQLARLGIGTIVAMDPDRFEEHNLNRQILCDMDSLGLPKVEQAARRVARINPAVTLVPVAAAFGPGRDGPLDGMDVTVDALDCIATRLELAQSCRRRGIPLVHGAIAGWYGQVLTVYPGDDGLERLYARTGDGRGAERDLGNPSFTPALVASLQVAETCKILLGIGTPLRGRMLSLDLLDMDFELVGLEDGS